MADLLKHYRKLVGIAKTWAEKHLQDWDDDMHRDLLQRHGAAAIDGRISASSLNVPQLSAVLDDYAARGWPRRQTYNPSMPRGASGKSVANSPKVVSPQISLIVKLWGQLPAPVRPPSATQNRKWLSSKKRPWKG